MDVTDAVLARVPRANVRVPREDFATVWTAAERRSADAADRGETDWYAGGVSVTCRWLAGAVAPSYNGRRRLPRSPATGTTARAHEELIEAEFFAAEQLDVRRPTLASARPGWSDAIRATLRWAWRRDGPPPLPLDARTAAG